MESVFFDSDSIAKIGLLMIDIFTKFVWVVGALRVNKYQTYYMLLKNV